MFKIYNEHKNSKNTNTNIKNQQKNINNTKKIQIHIQHKIRNNIKRKLIINILKSKKQKIKKQIQPLNFNKFKIYSTSELQLKYFDLHTADEY